MKTSEVTIVCTASLHQTRQERVVAAIVENTPPEICDYTGFSSGLHCFTARSTWAGKSF
jgi:hypothetical protein